MKILLADTNKEIIKAWEVAGGGKEYVEAYNTSIFDVEWKTIVSPGNSFGFMNGGIDKLICMNFGKNVQDSVQKMIQHRHNGELVVGNAGHVPIGDKYLIVAPTMRVPMRLGHTVNIYLAVKAALLLAIRHTLPYPIAFSGMGTGVGNVSPDIFVRQLKAALEEVVEGKNTFPSSWVEASDRHQLLYSNEVRNLQYE